MQVLWDKVGKQNYSLALFGQFINYWWCLFFLVSMEIPAMQLVYKKRLNSVGLLTLKKEICDWSKSCRMSGVIIRSAFKNSAGNVSHFSLQCKRRGLSQKSPGCRVKRSKRSKAFSHSTKLNCGTHCQWIVQRPKADSGVNYKKFLGKSHKLRWSTKSWT